MPNDFLGPTLEEVQVWLRSSSDSSCAGFVLSVEVVNARLGRVLVVEDDPGIAGPLVRGLTRAGYETGSVTTGQAALDWPVPDVVLLDLGLPDIDGVEVCRRLRQACDAAIIVVTARGEESDRVLVVEDDPGISTPLVRGLTRAGYETGSVTTGQAALDWPVPDVVPVSYTHLTLPTKRIV